MSCALNLITLKRYASIPYGPPNNGKTNMSSSSPTKSKSTLISRKQHHNCKICPIRPQSILRGKTKLTFKHSTSAVHASLIPLLQRLPFPNFPPSSHWLKLYILPIHGTQRTRHKSSRFGAHFSGSARASHPSYLILAFHRRLFAAARRHKSAEIKR
ncbi:hypothetical protein IQ06DRAFT_52207 [Phaeosphaeriaceae sp. SRC1lsM3a]|nr:hypothetical protein IQ06DRAFT_52207 [Stagonospora sp. SRC1lsM3a]